MKELTSKERRALRARAHKLDPVVIVGGAGLSDSVMGEIERSLVAHELIKVRAVDADRDGRDAMLRAICERAACAPVQHIGKMLVVYRPAPPEAEPERPRRPRQKPRAAGKQPAKKGR
jgi:RNA-binding protein